LYSSEMCYLYNNLVTMVICVSVHIEGFKGVQREGKVEVIREKLLTVDSDKVHTAKDAVDVHNRQFATPIGLKLRLYDPHACHLVGLIFYRVIPVHQCTRVNFVISLEREEEKNTPDRHSRHPYLLRVCLNEHSVVACVLTSPLRMTADPFAMHATGTTKIAGCIISCNGGVKNRNLLHKNRTLIQRNFMSCKFCVWITLVIKKASNELQKPGLLNVTSKTCYVLWIFAL
jgi:hypothetical protein